MQHTVNMEETILPSHIWKKVTTKNYLQVRVPACCTCPSLGCWHDPTLSLCNLVLCPHRGTQNNGLGPMVALQNSVDEKQPWIDLINQLNGAYDCLSILGQHRVAGINGRRGPELPVWGKGRGTAAFPSLPALTSKAKPGVNRAGGMQHLAWHDTVCHTQLCLRSQEQLSQQQLLQRFPSEGDLFLAPQPECSQSRKACTISKISAGWIYSWLEDTGEVSVRLIWFSPSCR